MPTGKDQRPDDLGTRIVCIGNQNPRRGHLQIQQQGDELVKQGSVITIAEHDPLVNAAGKREGETASGRANRQCHNLAGVAEYVFGLGVAF